MNQIQEQNRIHFVQEVWSPQGRREDSVVFVVGGEQI